MKKVLFATTALVATAGIASAEVSLKGSAEMGIVGGDFLPTTQFHTDIDVTFSMSGTTDNGLTFGASVDLDESDGSGSCNLNPLTPTAVSTCSVSGSSKAFGNTTQGGETISISGAFGTLTMGDTDGAFDKAMEEVVIGSSLIDEISSGAGYSGNSGLDGKGKSDGQILRYDYTFNAFTVSASAEIDDTGTAAYGDTYGLGVAYAGDLGGIGLTVGVGAQSNDLQDIYGVSVGMVFANGFKAILNYSDLDGLAVGNKDTHWAIGVGYTMNALTIGANYGSFDLVGGGSADSFALAVDYDLGGGAVIQFGYTDDILVSNKPSGNDAFSLGVSMAF